MTRKKRARVLRERYRALNPLWRLSQFRGGRRAPLPAPKRQPYRSGQYGVGLHEPERRKKWTKTRDEPPRDGPKPRRRAGVPNLVRIALRLQQNYRL